MRQHNRRRRQAFRLGTIAVFGLVASTSSASAQDGQADLSVGYLNVSGSRHGVIVQASMALTPRWSIVGEFDVSNGPDSGCSVGGPDFRDIAGLGGFRFAWHPTVRFAPFWQILAGGLHSRKHRTTTWTTAAALAVAFNLGSPWATSPFSQVVG